MMKIGIIGATGKSGKLIMQEAVRRGHDVTAIVRNASKLEEQDVAVIEKNILDLTSEDVKAFDVVVSAFGAPHDAEQAHVDAGLALIAALNGTNTRAIIVGGAGTLYVNEEKTVRMMDTPDFPEMFLSTAKGHARNLQNLQEASDITWTYISPSAMFDPEGARTGTYQSGKDHLLVNAKGDSYISYADYAIAVVDEIEQPKHINERFTVVGEANE